MGTAIELRDDFDAEMLRKRAMRKCDHVQCRRLLALAMIYDGATRSAAAKVAGVGLQIVRDWVLRFNNEGPDGLRNRKRRSRKVTDRAFRVEWVEVGPDPAVWFDGGSVTSLEVWSMNSVFLLRKPRLLREMGYAKLSARPCHYARDKQAIVSWSSVIG